MVLHQFSQRKKKLVSPWWFDQLLTFQKLVTATMALAAMASAAPYYDPYATPSPIYYKPMPNDFWYSDQYLNYLSRAERDGDAPTTPSPATYEAPVTEPATTPAPVND